MKNVNKALDQPLAQKSEKMMNELFKGNISRSELMLFLVLVVNTFQLIHTAQTTSQHVLNLHSTPERDTKGINY